MKKIFILLLFSASAFGGSLSNYGYEGCGYYRDAFGTVKYVCPDGRSGQRIFDQNIQDYTPRSSNRSSNYSLGSTYTPQQHKRSNEQAIDDIYREFGLTRD